VELLEVMLEETNDKSSELAEEISGSLNIAALHDTLADFYEFMNDPKVKRLGFDDEAERGLFRTYHILVHLSDYAIPSSIKERSGEWEISGLWKGEGDGNCVGCLGVQVANRLITRTEASSFIQSDRFLQV